MAGQTLRNCWSNKQFTAILSDTGRVPHSRFPVQFSEPHKRKNKMSTLFDDPSERVEDYLRPDQETLAVMHRGANWFYWIAGLSLVNSAIFAFGGQVSFILGLSYTQVIDVFSDAIVAGGGPEFFRWLA